MHTWHTNATIIEPTKTGFFVTHRSLSPSSLKRTQSSIILDHDIKAPPSEAGYSAEERTQRRLRAVLTDSQTPISVITSSVSHKAVQRNMIEGWVLYSSPLFLTVGTSQSRASLGGGQPREKTKGKTRIRGSQNSNLWNFVKVWRDGQIATLQTWNTDAWCQRAQETLTALVKSAVVGKERNPTLNGTDLDKAAKTQCGHSAITKRESDPQKEVVANR